MYQLYNTKCDRSWSHLINFLLKENNEIFIKTYYRCKPYFYWISNNRSCYNWANSNLDPFFDKFYE